MRGTINLERTIAGVDPSTAVATAVAATVNAAVAGADRTPQHIDYCCCCYRYSRTWKLRQIDPSPINRLSIRIIPLLLLLLQSASIAVVVAVAAAAVAAAD